MTIDRVYRVAEILAERVTEASGDPARELAARNALSAFRLSYCCGLRLTEICHLRMWSVNVLGQTPTIELHDRTIPLTLDARTYLDLGWHYGFNRAVSSRADLYFIRKPCGKPLKKRELVAMLDVEPIAPFDEVDALRTFILGALCEISIPSVAIAAGVPIEVVQQEIKDATLFRSGRSGEAVPDHCQLRQYVGSAS